MAKGLHYATGGIPDEYEHRNGTTVFFTDGQGGSAHLWFGRDYRRYVPGLYWLNYFSREFRDKHQIDVDVLAQRTGARIQEMVNGYLVRLYDSPTQWIECRDRIDEVIRHNGGVLFNPTGPGPEVGLSQGDGYTHQRTWSQVAMMPNRST